MILTGRNSANRSGVTLVELLVVISIIVLLAAFTIPSIQPAMEGRRVRLAARSVRAYLGAAQSRAIEKNRPVGVLFERFETDPRACRVLRQVEVPPPYAGDFEDSRISIMPVDFDTVMVQFQLAGALGSWSGENPITPLVGGPLIEPGDELQLNHQGHRWTIVSIQPDPNAPANSRWLWDVESQTTSGTPPTRTEPYQIFRQPVSSSVAPLVLPRRTVIDLDDSGDQNGLSTTMAGGAPGAVDVFAALDADLNDTPVPGVFDPNDPNNPYDPDNLIYRVMIMFSPSGGVDRVYRSEYNASDLAQLNFFRGTRPIFLMIGKWDRAGNASMLPEDGLHNWEDAENLWLALNPRTGQVTVAEVSTYYADPNTGQLVDNYDPATNRSKPPTVFDSRRYAREAQISRGGR